MNIFGLITLIAATTMSLIALPMQIRKNHKEQKVGLHWSLVVLSFIVYFSRAMYALTNATGIIWYIFISDAIGSITSVAIIVQLIKFKNNKNLEIGQQKTSSMQWLDLLYVGY